MTMEEEAFTSDLIGWGILCSDVEEWRDAVYSDYRVSSHGRVIGPSGKIFVRRPTGKGYFQIEISASRSPTGKPFRTGVHRIVALAFLGPPPTPKHEVAHGDGNPSNNNINNLRWATRKENKADSIRHGTSYQPDNLGKNCGEGNPKAKLTWKDVREIRELYTAKIFTQVELGIIYGVVQSTIKDIVRNKTWVEEDLGP